MSSSLDSKQSEKTWKICFETPFFSSWILLKDKKTKECVKLITVLSRNKTRSLERVFVYNPPAIHSGKHCKFIFKCHHREKWLRKKKPNVIAVGIENTFPSLKKDIISATKEKKKCEKQHSNSTHKSEVGKKLQRQQLMRIPCQVYNYSISVNINMLSFLSNTTQHTSQKLSVTRKLNREL